MVVNAVRHVLGIVSSVSCALGCPGSVEPKKSGAYTPHSERRFASKQMPAEPCKYKIFGNYIITWGFVKYVMKKDGAKIVPYFVILILNKGNNFFPVGKNCPLSRLNVRNADRLVGSSDAKQTLGVPRGWTPN